MSNIVLLAGLLPIWGSYAFFARRWVSVIPTVPFVPFALFALGFALNFWLPWVGTIVVGVLHAVILPLTLKEVVQRKRSSPSTDEHQRGE